ncbi:UbiH/UbiF/VisC/COQ6 family ubiquinone biosynthesis hydroxylase [Reinekea blandensis]|uniref:2-octaprenyl-3-methyl-6-methoxy-1,4-benzoquinol hydroxylase n=1 Tax=Reinekea blandensis MED297 TaxID=314283 RepID=A4BG86_9GAMM|nr:UbiH/UbiF/VisC/COQ6 family ubiquinone biosynthesis hydroxylase [Reinekea blandensis]EAR08881.1 2-octaprenyl-3-methyl-6-methoxy-1,4-benzoquinol hydroxylase [Reinekea sp. MED297] [Reinekea blandensis MED297]
MTTHNTHDIIISGAGMVGLATAIGLARAGLRVALLEKNRFDETPSSPGHFSARVSAINHTSEHLLRNLGAWDGIAKDRRSAYRQMDVWDGLGTGDIQFNADDVQVDHLGHIIENRHIVMALLEVARTLPDIELLAEETITQWQQDDSGVTATTSLDQTLRASLLIGSEGKLSPVREQSDIDLWRWSYDHSAVVTTVRHERPHQATARQVFLENGPLAFLPLEDTEHPQQTSSIVWSVLPGEAQRLLTLDNDEFCRELGTAFEHRLGAITHADPRFAFPLEAQQAKHYYDGRVVVLGDAAHTIHPLAGLGVNLGFLDAGALIDELVRAHEKQMDLGHAFVLRRYQRTRQSHNLAVAALMEGLKRGFTTQAALPVMLRNSGLSLLNRVHLLKRPLIQGALGNLGPAAPTLCRPLSDAPKSRFAATPHKP